MTYKLIHISDLHFGREDPLIAAALSRTITRLFPDLLVVSGDLTQRAHTSEYRAAADFLGRFDFPALIIPGNHDIPLFNLFRRFYRPLKKYRRYIHPEENPVHVDDMVAVMGVNTARSLTVKGGRISHEQIALIQEQLCQLTDGQMRILTVHHNPLPAVQSRLHPPFRRVSALFSGIKDCRIDLILAGHLHQSYTDYTTRFTDRSDGIVVAQAGTACSLRRRYEPNAFNMISIGNSEFSVEQWIFEDQEFQPVQKNRFLRRPS